MAKQNIYDNETFFAYFKGNRSTDINFNDCIETPILLSVKTINGVTAFVYESNGIPLGLWQERIVDSL